MGRPILDSIVMERASELVGKTIEETFSEYSFCEGPRFVGEVIEAGFNEKGRPYVLLNDGSTLIGSELQNYDVVESEPRLAG